MIPCKNCLILPICKHKKKIECDLLFKWWFRSEAMYNYSEDIREVEKYINVPIGTFAVDRSEYYDTL